MNFFPSDTLPPVRNLSARKVLTGFFLIFAVAWTVLPALCATIPHRDTIQILYWGREWELGYFKHPPLISWLSEFLYLGFGPLDGLFYLTSQAFALSSFYVIYRLARRMLPAVPAFVAVAALPIMGYYSYILPALNHNIALLLPWALAILLGYAAIEQRQPWAWPLMGLGLGFGILVKYTILLLPLVFLIHILLHKQHRVLLIQPLPWVSVALCLIVASPHLLWLISGDFSPLVYLANSANLDSRSTIERHLLTPLGNLGDMAGMCASLAFALTVSFGWPRRPRRKLSGADHYLLSATFGPPAIVVGLSVLSGGEMRTEWATPFFLTLPLVAMRLLYAPPTGQQINRFLTCLIGMSVAMAATFVLIILGFVPQLDESEWSRYPAREMAVRIEAAWHAVCPDRPVPVVIGDSWMAGTASYLLPGQPRVYTEANPAMSPWMNDAEARRQGGVIIWNIGQPDQFRELDHQEEIGRGAFPGWFPGRAELEARLGPMARIEEVTAAYHWPFRYRDLRAGLGVIPPETPCR